MSDENIEHRKDAAIGNLVRRYGANRRRLTELTAQCLEIGAWLTDLGQELQDDQPNVLSLRSVDGNEYLRGRELRRGTLIDVQFGQGRLTDLLTELHTAQQEREQVTRDLKAAGLEEDDLSPPKG